MLLGGSSVYMVAFQIEAVTVNEPATGELERH
jgi:hypothetical protein